MNDDVRQSSSKPMLETIAQGRQSPGGLVMFLPPEFQSGGHADRQRDRLGARPQSLLLMTAEQKRRKRDAIAQQQRPMPGGP